MADCRARTLAMIETRTSPIGQKRRLGRKPVTSGLPPTSDMVRHRTERRDGPQADLAPSTRSFPNHVNFISPRGTNGQR
jgi:hypothetical protein